MSFERGKDPKETMEIGRQKDAIQCVGVKYYTNGQEVSITDPEIIRIFLEQFTTYQLPINPVFGPQRILLVSSEKYLDDRLAIFASMYSASGEKPEPVEREKSISLNIFDYEGKTIIFNNKMYEMPNLQGLREGGYEYLEVCEMNHIQKTEKELRSRRSLMAEQMNAMKTMINSHYGSFRTPGRTENLLSPYNPPEENKPCVPEKKQKKKKWIFDIETFGI